MLSYNKSLKSCSQKLRREMTESEALLWTHIRKKQILDLQFYRQKLIDNFIVDFYCPKARLVIEIDGSQHFEEAHEVKDAKRDFQLQQLGLKVLRFTNLDIFHNLETVLDEIHFHASEHIGKIPL